MNNEDIENISKEQLVDAIINAEDGHLKVASEVGTGIIQTRIRENGFARTVIPPKNVSRTDLNTMLDTEMPVIIEEMENETYGAKIVSFDDAPDIAQFRGLKFAIRFFSIDTPKFTKNVFELMTYKNDFRQITVDHALKDMQRKEDTRLIAMADIITGPAGGVGLAGYEQNHEIEVEDPSVISRVKYNASTSYLEDHDLTNGLFLLNNRSAKWFNNFDRTEMGGDISEAVFKDGVEAIQNFKIFGYRHATTIKRDLVPNYTVYQFAPPNYMGRFYILQDTTMYVKKEGDWLSFHATEKIGMAIPNVAAIHKVSYVAAEDT